MSIGWVVDIDEGKLHRRQKFVAGQGRRDTVRLFVTTIGDSYESNKGEYRKPPPANGNYLLHVKQIKMKNGTRIPQERIYYSEALSAGGPRREENAFSAQLQEE
jgi:hypothetical protein